MSTAIATHLHADTGHARPPSRGIVRVLAAAWRRRRSLCTCGWSGPPRMTRAGSILDAHLHAARAGCHPAVPLVDVDIGRRP
jgi:hypothetical protein